MDYVNNVDPCDIYGLLVEEIESIDNTLTDIPNQSIQSFPESARQLLSTLTRARHEVEALLAVVESAQSDAQHPRQLA